MYLLNIMVEKIRSLAENDRLFDYIINQLQQFESLGPLPGILLPMLEAFLPILPLVGFVLANSVVYGLFQGFLYSWIGAFFGSVLVFMLVRRLGQKRFFNVIRRNKQVRRVMLWLEDHGFGPLFLLMCFPFSPSSVINVVAGLSAVSRQQFILAVFLGKSVMIFTVSYVGSSIASFAQNPVKTVVVGVCILLFWILGKFIEKRLQQKTRKRSHRSG
ncbi:TVP38/TMEM64 family protein [Halobacillus shinanisalinarum]|uniref:TVP38/TMEM64 family membrane protein n=1 Tax=Halobacillus shinanisalinarum TaxID=2932258 RepID=A0ABY4GY33_9BACI|nr:TVP38/TMEM64 family protein [Halobacillus shinanisalinarum]UOQ92789.1 TVP38/TMEM64 family protein [Halobacillus shinanisalinarum]